MLDETNPIAGAWPVACEEPPEPVAATAAGWQAIVARANAGVAGGRLLVRNGARPAWPAAGDLQALAACDVGALIVAAPVSLGTGNPAPTLAFLRFLRDCGTHGLMVAWQGCFAAGLPVALLSHLSPPTAVCGRPDAEAVCAWQAAYLYGQCYWRGGPGFVAVRDTRPGRATQRLVLDTAAEQRLFAALQRPRRTASCREDAGDRAALAALVEAGVALRLSGWALSLPVHMRTWPVPALAI